MITTVVGVVTTGVATTAAAVINGAVTTAAATVTTTVAVTTMVDSNLLWAAAAAAVMEVICRCHFDVVSYIHCANAVTIQHNKQQKYKYFQVIMMPRYSERYGTRDVNCS